jgi:hypothetical protein
MANWNTKYPKEMRDIAEKKKCALMVFGYIDANGFRFESIGPATDKQLDKMRAAWKRTNGYR